MTVLTIGAICFGVVTGYVTYRTLARKQEAVITDIAAVIAAVGGGAVTALFSADDESFGWYSIGLVGGMALYLVISLIINGKEATGAVMSAPDSDRLPG